MSRGFRNADETQAMSEKAVADQIERLLEPDPDARATRDGRCQDCGGPIGDERRTALRAATRCVRCQAVWEQGPGR